MHENHSRLPVVARSIRRSWKAAIFGVAGCCAAVSSAIASTGPESVPVYAAAAAPQSNSSLVFVLGIAIALIALRLTLDQDGRPSQTKAVIASLRRMHQSWLNRRQNPHSRRF